MTDSEKNSYANNSRKHSRVISAPLRRKSDNRTLNELKQKRRINRALHRLPGDANDSNTSSSDEDNKSQKKSKYNKLPEIVINPNNLTVNDETNRRRLSNLRLQGIIRKKIIEPMSDVDRRLDEHRKSICENLTKIQTTPIISINGELPTNVPNMLNSSSTSKGARFASIAKSITLLNKRNKNQIFNESSEQHEFFNKFGMSSLSSEHTNNTNNNNNNNNVEESFTFRKFITSIKTLIIDPHEESFYYWLFVVTIIYLYNLLFVPFRCVFLDDTTSIQCRIIYFIVDIVADIIYALDLFIRSRTGFLEQGLLVRDVKAIFKIYKKSSIFKIDIFCLLPCDYVLEFAMNSPKPILRFNRLAKLDRIQAFISSTETRIAFPNAFRIFCVVAYILVLIHWNGCMYFLVSSIIGLGSDSWVYGIKNIQSLPVGIEDTIYRRYIYSFYWSTLILTTIGEVPGPVHNAEYVFVTLDLMCGVLIFATIVGNVGSMISNMSAARAEFQSKIDGIKQYMDLRRVSQNLEMRVIKWFDYLWANKQTLADQQALNVLPNKLQAEIAMHVHFETLRKVRIFQDCEAGLLAELVLKLQFQVFSPGDYVCRKGDIGREMYIVKRGKLEVLADDGQTALATLQEGAVFGELSILNIAGSKQGNRRSANIRSVGYSDLFALSKDDLWEALKEYPDARKMLIQKGRDLLRKDNLLDENAPEENKTAEELAIELQLQLTLLQTKMAKLIAENTNYNMKMIKRIEWLERKLEKYENIELFTDDDGNLSVKKL